MQYLVTAEEMRQYDANTIEKIGIPSMVLMEHAAMAVEACIRARACGQHGMEKIRVLVVAGTGNNGADGLALARLLAQDGPDGKYEVDVWCVGETGRATQQWKAQREILAHFPVRILDMDRMEAYNIIVDALFGVGLSREVTGIWAEAVSCVNRHQGEVIAIDMPSGIDSDTGKVLGCAVRADRTVTFGFCKRGLKLYPGCEYAGEVTTVPIGITPLSFFGREPEMFYLDEPAERLLPERDRKGNKGTFGKLLLIAGSRNMAGAAVLAGRAAYRAGAGMVKLISPEENRIIIQEALPEALYGTPEQLRESLEWADVVAIGPGLGKSHRAKTCLETVIRECGKPLLIDADGLNLLSMEDALRQELAGQHRQVALTPHVGELARLLHAVNAQLMEGRSENAITAAQLKEKLWEHGRELAEALHATVAAKDARTFICVEGEPICMNLCGNSGMATAGSGDVLTGIIGGLMAQGMPAFRAACVGVRLHALAGDAVCAQKGEHACMAGDIVEYLGVSGNKLFNSFPD